ncbi:hypothetical protein BV898_05047 [Hypsibius exemplaris]|uniref:Uncharacterized protein n=1 Tax=Hypsibius exemplaris TaxID=2072580 RepID=A0A1W0X106_HYPEX|nr:hypothetical protein BV898_05047 [Hypsibius exemplaris]
MLQAEYENAAMDDNEGMVENEAMEVASHNGSALEFVPFASLMDVASQSGTKQFSFADGQRFPSWTACRTAVEKWQKETWQSLVNRL